jgi:hypothetical protein
VAYLPKIRISHWLTHQSTPLTYQSTSLYILPSKTSISVLTTLSLYERPLFFLHPSPLPPLYQCPPILSATKCPVTPQTYLVFICKILKSMTEVSELKSHLRHKGLGYVVCLYAGRVKGELVSIAYMHLDQIC